MITALAARWLFTVVFAVAVLGAVLPSRSRRGVTDAADVTGRVPGVSCVAMCGSLIATL